MTINNLTIPNDLMVGNNSIVGNDLTVSNDLTINKLIIKGTNCNFIISIIDGELIISKDEIKLVSINE